MLGLEPHCSLGKGSYYATMIPTPAVHRSHAQEETMPGSLQELERQLGVRLVVADRTDPEEVGYVS